MVAGVWGDDAEWVVIISNPIQCFQTNWTNILYMYIYRTHDILVAYLLYLLETINNNRKLVRDTKLNYNIFIYVCIERKKKKDLHNSNCVNWKNSLSMSETLMRLRERASKIQHRFFSYSIFIAMSNFQSPATTLLYVYKYSLRVSYRIVSCIYRLSMRHINLQIYVHSYMAWLSSMSVRAYKHKKNSQLDNWTGYVSGYLTYSFESVK